MLGYFLYSFTPAITLLRDDQGTSSFIAGFHGTCYAAGAVLIGFCGHRIVERYERARSVWLGLSGLCVGTVGLCIPGPPVLTLPAAFIASVGFSLLINTASTALADHHGTRSASAMNECNAVAAGVGLLAPLALGVTLSTGIGWRFGLLITVVLAGLVWAFMRVPIPPSRSPADKTALGTAVALSSTPLSAAFWWMWAAMATAVSTEFCLTIWASDVLRERTGASAGLAALGVTAVVIGIVAGRLFAARLASHIDVNLLLQIFLAVIALGFVVFWCSVNLWLSFAGLIICGLGIGPMFPLTFTALINASGNRPDLAAARSSLAIGLAVGVGPLAIGALTDATGAHWAILTVPVLVVLSMLAVRHSATLKRWERL
ncbi:MAG: MFS transporter, partial [Mycobacteriales bacterium]